MRKLPFVIHPDTLLSQRIFRQIAYLDPVIVNGAYVYTDIRNADFYGKVFDRRIWNYLFTLEGKLYRAGISNQFDPGVAWDERKVLTMAHAASLPQIYLN